MRRFLLALVVWTVGCTSAPVSRPDDADWPAAGVLDTPPLLAAAQTDAEATARPNFVGLFLGGTRKGGENGFSFGVEYVRRLSKYLGIGAAFESTPKLDRERIVILPMAVFFPWRELTVTVAPGVEFEDGDGSVMLRLGAGWEFEVAEHFTLSPEFNVDFVDGGSTAFVLGFTFGYKF